MNAADGFSVSIPHHASEKSCFSRRLPLSVERQSSKSARASEARGYPGAGLVKRRPTRPRVVSSRVEPRALARVAPTLARSPRGRARRRRLARSSRSLAGKLRGSRADRSGFSGQVASPDRGPDAHRLGDRTDVDDGLRGVHARLDVEAQVRLRLPRAGPRCRDVLPVRHLRACPARLAEHPVARPPPVKTRHRAISRHENGAPNRRGERRWCHRFVEARADARLDAHAHPRRVADVCGRAGIPVDPPARRARIPRRRGTPPRASPDVAASSDARPTSRTVGRSRR